MKKKKGVKSKKSRAKQFAAFEKFIASSDGKEKKKSPAKEVPDVDSSLKSRYKKLVKKQAKRLAKMEQKLAKRDLAANFASSSFISNSTTLAAPVATKYFAGNFSSGVPRFDNGKKVYSSIDPSKVADFEDAIEQIVCDNALRDQILSTPLEPGASIHSKGQHRSTTSREIFNKDSPSYSITAQAQLRKNNPTLWASLKALPPVPKAKAKS